MISLEKPSGNYTISLVVEIYACMHMNIWRIKMPGAVRFALVQKKRRRRQQHQVLVGAGEASTLDVSSDHA